MLEVFEELSHFLVKMKQKIIFETANQGFKRLQDFKASRQKWDHLSVDILTFSIHPFFILLTITSVNW
jgi:hypothetical protein